MVINNFKDVIGVSGVSNVCVIDNFNKGITVYLNTNGVNGNVQFSLSPEIDVINGTAEWSSWPNGVFNGTSYDVIDFPVTALRAFGADGALFLVNY